MKGHRFVFMFAVLSPFLAGCSGGDDSDATDPFACEDANVVQFISQVDSAVRVQVRAFDGEPTSIDVELPGQGSKTVTFTGGGTLNNGMAALQIFPTGMEPSPDTLIDSTSCRLSACIADPHKYVVVGDAARSGSAAKLVVYCSSTPPI